MGFWSGLFGGRKEATPQAAVQPSGGGVLISSPADLEAVMRGEAMSAAGTPVTPERAMRVAAVFGCVRLRSGPVATLPLHIKRRLDDRTREDAPDIPAWNILRRQPNAWQTPSQFKRMMQAHTLLRGNGYALKVVSRGEVRALLPLHPDRVDVRQRDDMTLAYTYTRPTGQRVDLDQADVFHVCGLSLDGIRGVSPITYARETIGLALAAENAGAHMFRHGPRASMVLEHPGKIGQEGRDNLRASLDEYRSGGDAEGKALIIEEGMKVGNLSITAEDAQWIESRKFSRSDIAMFFGVPPHMIGDTEKSTSWGPGLEQQTQGFVTFVLEDDLTAWEETINRDIIGASRPDVYARFNRAALVRGDIKSRWEAYVKGLQWGVYSPNEVRSLEDWNPRDGGDVYYPPPNTAGNADTGDGKGVKNDDDPETA